jgi:integrase
LKRKGTKRDINIITKEMVSQLLFKTKQEPYKVFRIPLLVLVETGMRWGDIYNLKSHNFIKETGEHFIVYTMHKTGVDQKKQISSEIANACDPWDADLFTGKVTQ